MTTQDAEIVRLGDNPIYYSQSEPLARNIDRHVQLKYPFYMFGEKSFEIDEDGLAVDDGNLAVVHFLDVLGELQRVGLQHVGILLGIAGEEVLRD